MSEPRSTPAFVRAVLFLLVAAGCSAPPPRTPDRPSPDRPRHGPRAEVRPTLEEVFLIPGVQGRPPRAQSLSADGAWLLLVWNPLAVDEHKKREISERASLRLLATGAPQESEFHGRPLEEFLPARATPAAAAHPPEDVAPVRRRRGNADELVTAWSHAGHRLAVARADQVFLLDRAAGETQWTVTLLYQDPPAASDAKPAEGATAGEGDTSHAPPPAVGTGAAETSAAATSEAPARGVVAPTPPAEPARIERVSGLAFTDGDRELRVTARSEEEYRFALGEDVVQRAPLALESARCATSTIEAKAFELQWSRDLTVAFSPKTPVTYLEPPAPEPAPATTTAATSEAASTTAPAPDGGTALAPSAPPAPRIAANVLDTTSSHAVALAGLADVHWLEQAELSPDGREVLARDVDRSSQPPATIVPDFLTPRVSTRESRRELADDVEPPVHLCGWDTSTGERLTLELPLEPGAHVGDLGWSPNESGPARYALRVVSADYRDAELWCWSDGLLHNLFSERDERWIGGPAGGPRWSGDGRSILDPSEVAPGSTTPGRCQIFAIDPASGAPRQLTEVAGEVSSFVTRRDGSVLFTASDSDPARRWIGYLAPEVVRGDAPARVQRLNAPAGWNTTLVAGEEGTRVVFAHEELGRPAELWCTEIGSSAPAVRLTDTLPEAYRAIDWILPASFETHAADGVLVRSHVYLPSGSSLEHPDRARACIVFIHGAGYLQNVTDSMTEYEVNLMFHSRLAREGYVVLDVDYRGSEGYGGLFRTDVQYHLGGKDLSDIHDTVDALAARGVIDGARVACYGGSYGGFLTLMALFTAPERWTCGAALRSVTDWRTYAPSYTQPRLGRPSTNADAYAASSPIDHVAGLVDPLLVLHGMVDTNVFAQDSIRLIEMLIDQGKDFEAMLYPSQGHGFEDGMHWLDEYRRIERFLTEHLGAP